MNNIQINHLNDRLNSLGKFTQNRSSYKESAIIDWIADCVNLFYEIGVDSVIIRNFLDHFRSRTEEIEIEVWHGGKVKEKQMVNAIGPFREEIMGGLTPFRTGNYVLAGSFYYAKVAFSAATNTLKNKVEEKRIVPFWMVEQISQAENLTHIASSLELIETKYEQGNTDGLVSETITLLESILNLDSELEKKGKLGSKLNTLIDNPTERQKFGVSEDLVRGINCGRILRNEKMTHKKASLKYEFPFLIASSFSYLVLFFVECAILNGKVISFDKK